MRFAIVALVCVLLVLGGCTSVPVGVETADVPDAGGGAGPAFLMVILVIAAIVGGAIGAS